jgi:hypothetical protein
MEYVGVPGNIVVLPITLDDRVLIVPRRKRSESIENKRDEELDWMFPIGRVKTPDMLTREAMNAFYYHTGVEIRDQSKMRIAYRETVGDSNYNTYVFCMVLEKSDVEYIQDQQEQLKTRRLKLVSFDFIKERSFLRTHAEFFKKLSKILHE